MSRNLCEILLAGTDSSRVDGGFESVFVFKALGSLSEDEFLKKVEEIFLDAVHIHNDKAALGALRIIAKFHGDFRGGSQEQTQECFKKFTTYFWVMPYFGVKGVDTIIPTLEESKKFIIQWAMEKWQVYYTFSPGKLAKSIFQFVADCYDPIPKPSRGILGGTPAETFKWRTRDIHERNRSMIEGIIRKAVGGCSSADLLPWIKLEEEWMPEKFRSLLAVNWARNASEEEILENLVKK